MRVCACVSRLKGGGDNYAGALQLTFYRLPPPRHAAVHVCTVFVQLYYPFTACFL